MISLRKILLGLALTIGLAMAVLHWVQDPIAPRPGEHRGIDVSAHQGPINWAQVAAAGIHFAYIKASEGGDWVDEHFQRNWSGAKAAGLKPGAYHFFTLSRPGADQADNFLKVAPPDPDSLSPAVDLEFGGNSRVRPPRDQVIGQLREFLARVESAHGRPAILYLLPEFESHYRIREAFQRELWIRSLLTRPAESDGWKIWQTTPLGRVPGIQGPVDLNLGRW